MSIKTTSLKEMSVKDNILYDSRGAVLNVGDFVFIGGNIGYVTDKDGEVIIRTTYTKFSPFRKNSWDYYCTKIDDINFLLNLYAKYDKTIRMDMYNFISALSKTTFYHNMECELQDYRQSHKTVRGKSILDIEGRSLKLGDLVICDLDHKKYSYPHYAIITSSTKVFNEYGKEERAFYVQKVDKESYTQEEVLILNKIGKLYNESNTVVDNDKIPAGSVCRHKNSYYLKLGKCKFNSLYRSESNVVISAMDKLDKDKDIWVDLGERNFNDKLERDAVLSYLSDSVFNLEIEKKKHYITKQFYTEYLDGVKFKSVSTVKRNYSKPLFNINLGKEITLNPSVYNYQLYGLSLVINLGD